MPSPQSITKCVRCALSQPPKATILSTSITTSAQNHTYKPVIRRSFSSSPASHETAKPQKSMSELLAELGAQTRRTNPLDFIPAKAAASQSQKPTTTANTPDWMTQNLGQSLLRDLSRIGPSPLSSTLIRLKPSLGRTVRVTGNDLGKSLRALDRKCNENSIRRDEISQRFHVRRGQAKKILRMRRWRALFKEGFIAECAKIRRMRKQGW